MFSKKTVIINQLKKHRKGVQLRTLYYFHIYYCILLRYYTAIYYYTTTLEKLPLILYITQSLFCKDILES